MVITFWVKKNTLLGENIFICSDCFESGSCLLMSYNSDYWKITVNVKNKSFNYRYIVKVGSDIVSEEKDWRTFDVPYVKANKTLVVDEYGVLCEVLKPMKSSVFVNAISSLNPVKFRLDKNNIPIVFNVYCDKVLKDLDMAICGNCRTLKQWSETNPEILSGANYPKYQYVGDALNLKFPLEYKYSIFDRNNNEILCWEDGENRKLNIENIKDFDLIIINDNVPRFNRPQFKGAGVAIPIFSLRSESSFGCGEFLDLKLLVDWCVLTNQKIIQTLPINDTSITGTWHDSYPYSSISTMALHPIYINVEKVGKIKNIERYYSLRDSLNRQKFLDYEAVMNNKKVFLREIFESEKSEIIKNKSFKEFLQANKSWLLPYAVFCCLRDKYNTSNFNDWDGESDFSKLNIEIYLSPKYEHYDDVLFYIFIQYHLHNQIRESVLYAHQKGIAIKGDIPIGVNKYSVDTWVYPNLFDCNSQAGAPPDDFSKTGQNWGFPTYNWEEMQKDNYRWWKMRFEKMAEYFDAYRIDHILGFFRIFRIPANQRIGLLGQFYPTLPMSEEEIRAFGFDFDKEKHCYPIITEECLDIIFEDKKNIVKEKYLLFNKDNNSYDLREEVETQEKIDNLLSDEGEEKDIKAGLFALTCQVLFTIDEKEKSKYHPRIAVYQSIPFKYLSVENKEIINRIYNYYYYQRHEEFWKKCALEKLPVLTDATSLLACGEDLGMVPNCVAKVMNELQILSLEIQRMPKEIGLEFGNLNRNPYLSVCTTSTHDMSTMRAWWEEDKTVTQRFFNNELHQFGLAPTFCEPWICQLIIEKHLNCPSQWVILPIQDWLSVDGSVRWNETFSERINNPANPNNYWRYRMHITLESLINESNLNNIISSIICESGR